MSTPAISRLQQNSIESTRTQSPASNNHRQAAELTTSEATKQRIITWEGGFVARNYNDQGGNCTNGAGTLLHMGRCTPAEVAAAPMAQQQMRTTFELEIRAAEVFVRQNVARPLTQNQFDALVSLTYNAGPGSQTRHNGAQPVYDAINRLGPEEAASTILNTATTVAVRDHQGRVIRHQRSQGLVNRRQNEAALYQGRTH